MSHILWTLPYLPWPLTSGGKVRQFHLISQMHRRGHSITLLVQSKSPMDEDARQALEPLVERLIVLPRRSLRSTKTLLAALFSPWPVLTSVNSHAPVLVRAFEKLLADRWDVIQIEHSYSAEPYLAALSRRRQPYILTEHNVESALGSATYGKWPRILRPFAMFDRWRARRWERKVLSGAERVVAVTTEDAAILGEMTRRPIDVVGNGVDARAFAEVRPDVGASRILFLGNFEYAPNIDAVDWTLTAIMPLVWKQFPKATLVVCGYAMPTRWQAEHADPRIEWLGYVPRLAAIQSGSSAFLAPLRQGGGSKLKVLEAMAAGLPLVTTNEGISGLRVVPGEQALVADDPQGLADHLVAVLSDPVRGRAIGEAGRTFVRERHDWTAAADALEGVYARLLQGSPEAVERLLPQCA